MVRIVPGPTAGDSDRGPFDPYSDDVEFRHVPERFVAEEQQDPMQDLCWEERQAIWEGYDAFAQEAYEPSPYDGTYSEM